jgi:hypothetical protein
MVSTALAAALSAPMVAQASAGGTSTAFSGMQRQLSAVSAKVVSAGKPAQAAGLGNTFWESPQGGHTIQTDCLSGNTPGVHNWTSTCANNEDQVQNPTPYYARVHYMFNGYGAYACMLPNSYWLYLSTSGYDFSYPGEGYQPYGATAGQYQKIAYNAASEALTNSCA